MAAIGVLTLELRLEESHSLKEKRHVVESLKNRLRHKFNVSVAEIDHQDLWQRSAVAAVTVSSDHVHAEKVLRSVEDEAAALLGRSWRNARWSGWHERRGMGARGRGPETCCTRGFFVWMSGAHYGSPRRSARN